VIPYLIITCETGIIGSNTPEVKMRSTAGFSASYLSLSCKHLEINRQAVTASSEGATKYIRSY